MSVAMTSPKSLGEIVKFIKSFYPDEFQSFSEQELYSEFLNLNKTAYINRYGIIETDLCETIPTYVETPDIYTAYVHLRFLHYQCSGNVDEDNQAFMIIRNIIKQIKDGFTPEELERTKSIPWG